MPPTTISCCKGKPSCVHATRTQLSHDKASGRPASSHAGYTTRGSFKPRSSINQSHCQGSQHAPVTRLAHSHSQHFSKQPSAL